MSRSKRHTPIIGLAGDRSEKWSKRHANHLFRRNYSNKINEEDDVTPSNRKVWALSWNGAKDGKAFFDKKKYPEGMRK